MLEAALREALAVLQTRCDEQSAQLASAKTLEGILREAQAVLEQRLAQLTTDSRRSGDELPKAKR